MRPESGIEQFIAEATEAVRLAGENVMVVDRLSKKALSGVHSGRETALADVAFSVEASVAARATHVLAKRVLDLVSQIAREMH